MKLDPWYVTGFAEGEGSFTYSRSGPRIELYFAIKLTRADRSILSAIQRFFGGIGTIYEVGPRAPSERSGFTKAASYYRVCRKQELLKVVAHFDEYPPVGSKLKSYRTWREMVVLKNGPFRAAIAELHRLAEQLTAASPRNAVSGIGLQGSGTGPRAPRRRVASPSTPKQRDDTSVRSGDHYLPVEE